MDAQQLPHWRNAAADALIARVKMQQRNICNVQTLLTDLKSCSTRKDLQWGRRIYVKAVESQNDSNMYVVTALISMYGKCGSMVDARRIFDSIQKPDVVSWNAVLLGYADNGDELHTMELFLRMKACRCEPNSVTYMAVLKACRSLARKQNDGGKIDCLKRGKEIHSEIGGHLNISLQNTLIDMYSNCSSMIDARLVFDSIQKPNVVSWNALLLGYADNGGGFVTLELFSKMKACGCVPDSITYVATLKACTSLVEKRDHGEQGECLKLGRKIHSEIGCNLNIFVQNTLIDMYSKCGIMAAARRVFDGIQKPNVVSWNALLMGYADNGEGLASLDLLSRMKASGCAPNSVTYIAALKSCTCLAGRPEKGGHGGNCLVWGRRIHSEIGCNMNILVQSTLVDMYCKCGSLVDARSVFESIQKPNVVCWNALIQGYAENGEELALECFLRMKASGCVPDSVSYVASLRVCGLIGALAFGRKLHLEMREFTTSIVTGLVDFYAKCGSILEARNVFDGHPRARDVSTWTAMIGGYGSLCDSCSVFNLVEAMQDQGFRPNAVTFMCILSTCSHAGLVEKARQYFNAMPLQYGITPTVMHYTCMVDVLGRANQLNEAMDLLREMPCNPDTVTWMTLLAACRKWKNVEIGRCAFQSLVDMDKKIAPDYAHFYGRDEQQGPANSL